MSNLFCLRRLNIHSWHIRSRARKSPKWKRSWMIRSGVQLRYALSMWVCTSLKFYSFFYVDLHVELKLTDSFLLCRKEVFDVYLFIQIDSNCCFTIFSCGLYAMFRPRRILCRLWWPTAVLSCSRIHSARNICKWSGTLTANTFTSQIWWSTRCFFSSSRCTHPNW